MNKQTFYSRYNPPPQIGLRNDQPSMTQQHFTGECDVNQILAKFIRTGILDTIGPGVYADLHDMGDYRQSITLIEQAKVMFAELPSAIRKRFDNDPAQYLDFVHNTDNLDEGIALGIFSPKTKPILEKQDQNSILDAPKTD